MEPTNGQSLGRSGDEAKPPRSKVATYAPIAIVAVIVIAVIVAVVASGGDDKKKADVSVTTNPSRGSDGAPAKGVVSWTSAKAAGTTSKIDWGKRCDTSLGTLALPIVPLQPCYAPFTGNNGGATATGVTDTTIKVVVYLPQADDPVLKFIYAQINDTDTPDDTWATYQKYNDMYAKYYETYGRKVQLIRFNATGNIQDSVAAIADAATISQDIKPFMVLGGPLLTNAFADALASAKVACVSCAPGQPDDWYNKRAPYVWDIQKDTEQSQLMAAEYIGKRLANHPAVNAGGDLKGKPRVFGYIHVVASDTDKQLEQEFTSNLESKYHVKFADIEAYASPLDLAGSGRDLITRLKAKGVTSIVFAGDPLAPQTLTKVATQQDYTPEWIITGSALVDTTAFSRTYDQAQWSHAFGPSNLAARLDPNAAGSLYLYKWYYGETAPASHTAPVILPNIQFLYFPLQAMGPDVTAANMQTTLFNAPVTPGTPISPQLSYGNHGFYPNDDHTAIDDQTEVWWDPAATGVDELGESGTGMYEYVDGGKRYLPGQWPKTVPDVFTKKGAVTVYSEPPANSKIPTDYTPVK
jgi:hypothetical protein